MFAATLFAVLNSRRKDTILVLQPVSSLLLGRHPQCDHHRSTEPPRPSAQFVEGVASSDWRTFFSTRPSSEPPTSTIGGPVIPDPTPFQAARTLARSQNTTSKLGFHFSQESAHTCSFIVRKKCFIFFYICPADMSGSWRSCMSGFRRDVNDSRNDDRWFGDRPGDKFERRADYAWRADSRGEQCMKFFQLL